MANYNDYFGNKIAFKNRIINGDFQINQRQDALVSNESKYPIDRVFVDAIDSKVGVTDEDIYSPNEGAMGDDTDPFGDGSQTNLYQFEGDATDRNGNNDGTVNNCDFVDGKFGQCVFTDIDNTSYVEVDNIPDIFDETDKTFSCWVNFEDSASIISSARDSDKNSYRCAISGNIIIVYEGTNIYFSNPIPKDKIWHHFLFTVSSDGTKIYIDGKLDTTDSRTVINDSGTDCYKAYSLGNFWDNIANNNIGTPNVKIDQVRIFNRALSEDEVRKLYVEDYQYIQKKHLKTEIISKGDNPVINPYVYKFEGQHIADIIKEPVALSFDFYSNKTGSYNVKLVTECLDGTQETFETAFNHNGTDFERIEIVIPEGTFTKDIINGERLGATLYIAPNAENNVDVGDFIRLANIQLEKGSVATEFEHIPYDIQLLRCMRYYEIINRSDVYRAYAVAADGKNEITYWQMAISFKVLKRAIPTVVPTFGSTTPDYNPDRLTNETVIYTNSAGDNGFQLLKLIVDADL